MKQNIFHNASVKLTGIYLLIIMAISLVFSVGLYRVASQEVTRGIRRQDGPIGMLMRNPERFPQEIIDDILASQEATIDDSLRKIKANLFLINMFILVSGGLLSYYFARRTLAPIEKAHEAQSRFAADASHELRTPLTAMKLETELTLTEPKLTLSQAKQQLQSNLEELDKLTILSENMLRLSRLENDTVSYERISLHEVVNEAVARVQALADKKKQTIKTTVKHTTIVRAERMSLSEALVTILENAVKYTGKDGKITITSKNKNTQCTIEITDNGIGISPEHVPHIFDRFYRADSSRTNSKTNGFGIGLSIAKTAIEKNGGTITVESVFGGGSTFIITLPLA